MRKSLAILCFAFGVATAHAGDEGVTASEIRLGASAVLSGPLGAQTSEYGAGSRLYFDHVNAKGGVFGRKIVYTTIDDGFDVKRAAENTAKLINEEKVFMIYNNTGTAHTMAILPLLEETRTIAFGPVTGASPLREKFSRYLFHVRAGYANEAHRIVGQLKQMGITRAVVFYQDDAFGKALLGEVRAAASEIALPLAAEVKIDPKQPDFATAAAQASQARPQAVIMGTGGTTFPLFMKAMRETTARPSYYGFSVASPDVINKELGPDAKGIVLAQIMPSLRRTSEPAVAEYLALLRSKSPDAKPSASQFEGFVQAKLLVDGLRRAGPKLGTESFIKAMESAGEIRFGAFTARYSPQSHNGASYVDLAIIDNNGQLRY